MALGRAPRVSVEGVFERHVNSSWKERALVEGSRAGGRWAQSDSFPVIYLGRPTESVIVEAYRHLVDDIEGMTPERVRGRQLIRAHVNVAEVVDLRERATRLSIGITDDDIMSDVGDYEACQRIGHIAHQLNRHGILVPSPSGLGETLALFVDYLSPAELPEKIGAAVEWRQLPPDPRMLRLVEPTTEAPSA